MPLAGNTSTFRLQAGHQREKFSWGGGSCPKPAAPGGPFSAHLKARKQSRVVVMAATERPDRRRVVTGIVRRSDTREVGAEQVLLLQRSQEVRSYQGRWACISGSVESGEQPVEAMWREMEEETGWVRGRDLELVRAGLPLDVDDSPRPGKTYSFRVHPFLFHLKSDAAQQSPNIDWEHTGYQWQGCEVVQAMEAAGETVPRLHETLLRVWDPPALVEGEGLRQRAAVLFNDHQRGAAELARDAAALVLDGADAESVAALRPTMVALVNVARRAAAPGGGRVAEELQEALDAAVADATAALRSYSVLATLSRSSSVMGAVRRLAALGDAALRSVLVGESLPGGEGQAAAEMMAKACDATLIRQEEAAPGAQGTAGKALAVLLLPDDHLERAILDGEADVLVLGADAVLSDGSVVNKVGSTRLALACQRARPPVPVVVVADRFKAWDDVCPPCLEDAFEVVPAHLITRLAGLPTSTQQ